MSCSVRQGHQLFRDGQMKIIKGEPCIPMDELLSPCSVFILDEKLLVTDKHDGKLVTEISLEDSSMLRKINIGNGPHEFINVSDIYDLKDEFVIFDNNRRLFSRYSSKDGFNCCRDNYVGSISFALSETLYSIIPFQDNYIATGCFGDDIFAVIAPDMSVISRFGQYPEDDTGVGSQEFCLKNQMTLCADPQWRYFVAAGFYNDWLAFYKYENADFILEKEYFSADAELKITGYSDGKISYYSCVETPNTVRTYRGLYSTDDYFYALYWGVKSGDIAADGNSSMILRFSLEGKYIDGYMVDGLLKSFAVSRDNRTMYAISGDQLWKYSL